MNFETQILIPVLSWGDSIYDTKYNVAQRFAVDFLDKTENSPDYLNSNGKKRFISEKALIGISKGELPHVSEAETTKTLYLHNFMNHVKALLDYLSGDIRISRCSAIYWKESRCLFHSDIDILLAIMEGYMLVCKTIGCQDDFDMSLFFSLCRYNDEKQIHYDIINKQIINPITDRDLQSKILNKVHDLQSAWNQYKNLIDRTTH